MLYFQGTTEFYSSGESAVTLGKFDGVHRGHQKLIRRICAADGLQSIVFSFNSRPDQVLCTEYEQKLIVQEMGADCLIQCPFVPQISGMDPDTFVGAILRDRLHVKYLAVGPDFRFGCRRSGDVDFLRGAQARYGFSLEVVEKETYGDREISSTFVREELEKGNMELVADLLGRPFFVTGKVRQGHRLGRRLGVPTLNLVPPAEKLLPPDGVYVSRTLAGGTWHRGITNVGWKPTVGERFRGVETHLFDSPGDLYGEEVLTQLLFFRRPEEKFSGVEELKAHVYADIAFGKEYFGE